MMLYKVLRWSDPDQRLHSTSSLHLLVPELIEDCATSLAYYCTTAATPARRPRPPLTQATVLLGGTAAARVVEVQPANIDGRACRLARTRAARIWAPLRG